MISLTISFISSFVYLWLRNNSWHVASQHIHSSFRPGVLWRDGRARQSCFFTYSCIPSSSGKQKNLTALTVKLQHRSTTKLQNLNAFYMGLNVLWSLLQNTVQVYCIISGQYIMKENDFLLQKHIHKENMINSLETLRYILYTM